MGLGLGLGLGRDGPCEKVWRPDGGRVGGRECTWYGEDSFMPFISTWLGFGFGFGFGFGLGLGLGLMPRIPTVRKAGRAFSEASCLRAWCTVAVLPVPGVPDR